MTEIVGIKITKDKWTNVADGNTLVSVASLFDAEHDYAVRVVESIVDETTLTDKVGDPAFIDWKDITTQRDNGVFTSALTAGQKLLVSPIGAFEMMVKVVRS